LISHQQLELLLPQSHKQEFFSPEEEIPSEEHDLSHRDVYPKEGLSLESEETLKETAAACFYKESHVLSKAERRRQRRADRQEKEDINRQETLEGIVDHRKLEMEAIGLNLQKKNFRLHSVASDGHCLYRAIEHQLRLSSDSDAYGYQKLRNLAADYIEANKSEFLPYMDKESDSTSAWEDYCNGIRGSEWGGEVEIRALSHVLRRPITIQDRTGTDMVYGDEFRCLEKSPIQLVFHRHLMALGAHYNSVVPYNHPSF